VSESWYQRLQPMHKLPLFTQNHPCHLTLHLPTDIVILFNSSISHCFLLCFCQLIYIFENITSSESWWLWNGVPLPQAPPSGSVVVVVSASSSCTRRLENRYVGVLRRENRSGTHHHPILTPSLHHSIAVTAQVHTNPSAWTCSVELMVVVFNAR